MPVPSRTVRQILTRNGLHGRIAAQKPVLKKRQLSNRVAYAKAHSQINRQLSSQVPPILSMTLRGPSGPTVHSENSQIWRWKDYGLGLHPIRRCQGDL